MRKAADLPSIFCLRGTLAQSVSYSGNSSVFDTQTLFSGPTVKESTLLKVTYSA